MKKILLLSIMLSLSLNASAVEKIRSYKVPVNHGLMTKIADQFEVVKKLSDGFEVYVQEKDLSTFLKLAPNAKLLLADIRIEQGHAGNAFSRRLFKSIEKYRKFADVERDLIKISKDYKNLATLITYGVSKEGRSLYALKISTSKGAEKKPKLMVTAATHGDELVTVEVLFSLLNELLSGYSPKSEKHDVRLAKIIEGRDLYFIPVVSPDSFELRERYVEGVDPNRSFPWPENINNKPASCIQALMDFADTNAFTGSLDLHAYGKLVMYPWGFTEKPPEAKDVLAFGDLVQSMSRENRYLAGQISTTIYIAKGSSADYFYWKKNTQAIAVELSDSKVPPYETIPQIVDEAREMLWTFFEHFQ